MRKSDAPFKQVDIANKVSHKTAIGPLVNLLGRAHLQHLALAHHGNARGHRHRLFLVMRHHHTGHADRFNDVDQLKLGLLAQLLVQRAQRFIQQQQLRLFRQASGQSHALLLST